MEAKKKELAKREEERKRKNEEAKKQKEAERKAKEEEEQKAKRDASIDLESKANSNITKALSKEFFEVSYDKNMKFNTQKAVNYALTTYEKIFKENYRKPLFAEFEINDYIKSKTTHQDTPPSYIKNIPANPGSEEAGHYDQLKKSYRELRKWLVNHYEYNTLQKAFYYIQWSLD